MKAFVVKAGSTSLTGLQLMTREKPSPGAGEILVQMKAVSLNFRDLMIPLGRYMGGPLAADAVALSDGTGEVVGLGEGVTRFKLGDRVAGTFFRNWIDGPPAAESRPGLGAGVDGVLAEYVAFHQNDAVGIPANLSYEEAATLPCAGVTAWNTLLVAGKAIRPGDTVLVLGTGGVSIMALQLARAAGARVIATSSSDEKLARAGKLGADTLINYKTTPEWQEAVLKATQGLGVDCVVEVGGLGTLSRSMASLAMGGKVCMIGFVAGPAGDANPQQVIRSGGNLHGIFVGNRAMFEQLNKAIEVNDIHPVIDRVFSFDESPAAYEYMQSQAHFGKIVIRF
ncbi:MAG: NAD(P)-dependent alcohol dehydrogenase [Pseudomonadales bacterium]|nr:NAD(P)-dependent alcohol dehydrogenase [Pseudomonadales bacterium]